MLRKMIMLIILVLSLVASQMSHAITWDEYKEKLSQDDKEYISYFTKNVKEELVKNIKDGKLDYENPGFRLFEIKNVLQSYGVKSSNYADEMRLVFEEVVKLEICRIKKLHMKNLKDIPYRFVGTKIPIEEDCEKIKKMVNEFLHGEPLKLSFIAIDFQKEVKKTLTEHLIPEARKFSGERLKRYNNLKSNKLQPQNMMDATEKYMPESMDLDRLPLDPNGKNYRVFGQIVKKDEGGYYLAKYETYNDIRYFKFKPKKRISFNENQWITIIGTLVGIETYQTTLGVERRMPMLELKFIKL